MIRLLPALLPCLFAGCGTLDIGGIAAFLGPGVTVVIENDTSFTAIPDLRTSDNRNDAEDLFAEEDQVAGFGVIGTIQPKQTVTVRLGCDGELERIVFSGAEFREGNGFALGDLDADTELRRGSDFDCGDIIHIRLSGSIFNFYAEVELERPAPIFPEEASADEDDEIADFLDDLFD